MKFTASTLAALIIVLVLAATTPFTTVAVHAHMFNPKSGVVALTPDSMGKFLSTHKAAYVMFYAPWCGHCKSMVPEWEKFAKVMKDVVKVAAIDVDQHKAIGSQFRIEGFPTVKYWPMGKKNGVKPLDYVGPRTASAFQNSALMQIKHKTVVATSKEQLAEATAKTSLKKAFVLFTNKDKAAPLYNVLSFSPHYDGKIAFVVVKASAKNGKALMTELLGADAKVPSMHVVSENAEQQLTTTEYTGPVEYNAIAKYLLSIAQGGDGSTFTAPSSSEESAGSDDASSASSDDNNNDNNNNNEKKPPAEKKPPKRALPVEVTEFNAAAAKDFCSGTALGRKQPFCVLVFSTQEVDPAQVRAYFDQEPILFFTTGSADVLTAMQQAFPEGAPSTTRAERVLVYRSTKPDGAATKYVWIDGQSNMDVQNNIGQILEGLLRMTKATGLPEIA